MEKSNWLGAYRAIIAGAMAIILSLLATIGSDVRETLRDTAKIVGSLQNNMARLDGRVDEQGQRIGHAETAIQSLTEKAGTLDNRVTVLEHRGKRDVQD